MTKFPIMLYNTKSTKKALVPPIPPPSSYEDAVGWAAIEAGYKTALRGSRKFTREAVLYDLYSEVNNVRLWRDLKKIEKTRQAGVSEYTPGKYRHRIIVEPKERSLHIPPLRERREDIPPLCRSLLDELCQNLCDNAIRSCRRSSARYSSTVHLRVCMEKAPSEPPSTYSTT